MPHDTAHDDQDENCSWLTEFRSSRWFTRCWTLPELIAPPELEFYSEEGSCLGTRDALVQLVHEITGIPVSVFQGRPLSDFSIEDCFEWARGRQATRIEDQAYSLMGIFDVYMPLLYGEGLRATQRLLREIGLQATTPAAAAAAAAAPTPTSPHALPVTRERISGFAKLSDSEFRWFVLDPGQANEAITGRLAHFNVSQCPPYYALSYVWGDEPKLHPIRVDGNDILLQPNLFHALLRIRPKIGRYHIWVDTLCINQQDHLERSLQVKQMASIYNGASGVWIWLGEEDSTSKIAIGKVSEILSEEFKWGLAWWEHNGFAALALILQRSWFRRGWVIQEAAYSKSSELRCGDETIHLDRFVMVVNMVRNKLGDIPPSVSAIFANFYDSPATRLIDIIKDAFVPSRQGHVRRRRLSLETLIDLTTSTETSDKRDAVYALLNLANDIALQPGPKRSDAISPNYQKPTLDVFVDLIVHCCNQWGSLDIICRPWAPVSSSSGYNLSYEGPLASKSIPFPSWIAPRENLPFGGPSWGSKHRFNGNPLVGRSRRSTYYAHYGLKPQVVVGKKDDGGSDGSLIIKGISLGEIQKVSTRMAEAMIYKDCLEILVTDTPELAENDSELPDVVWRTLCADRDVEGHRAPHSYSAAMMNLLRLNYHGENAASFSEVMTSMSSIDVEEMLHADLPEITEEYLKVVRTVIWNRRTFCTAIDTDTRKQMVGLVPRNARASDRLCILYGCSVPVVLRRILQLDGVVSWQLIGNAYVHNAMDGETVSSSPLKIIRSKEQDFRLI